MDTDIIDTEIFDNFITYYINELINKSNNFNKSIEDGYLVIEDLEDI